MRELGEVGRQRFDLSYQDLSRLEFVAPDTVIVGFGLVTFGSVQQMAVSLGSLGAQDAFDNLVECIERRNTDHTYSILDDTNLSYSQPWTWEDRFPGFGLATRISIDWQQNEPPRHLRFTTREGEEFHVSGGHGLTLAPATDPECGLMQVFNSQLIDGAGFALSLIERREGGIGFRTSRDELLWIDVDGDIWLDGEMVGDVSVEPIRTAPESMPVLFGGAPNVTPDIAKPNRLRMKRPLPKAWLLALALVSMLPRGSHAEDE